MVLFCVFMVNFEQIWHIVQVFLLLILNNTTKTRWPYCEKFLLEVLLIRLYLQYVVVELFTNFAYYGQFPRYQKSPKDTVKSVVCIADI